MDIIKNLKRKFCEDFGTVGVNMALLLIEVWAFDQTSFYDIPQALLFQHFFIFFIYGSIYRVSIPNMYSIAEDMRYMVLRGEDSGLGPYCIVVAVLERMMSYP